MREMGMAMEMRRMSRAMARFEPWLVVERIGYLCGGLGSSNKSRLPMDANRQIVIHHPHIHEHPAHLSVCRWHQLFGTSHCTQYQPDH